MQPDYINKDSVASLMKQAGLPKFKITKAGAQKNSTPIFECLNTTNNSDAIKRFEDWAELIENSNAYEMTMFENLENAQIENPDAKTKKGKVIRFVFALNGYGGKNQPVNLGNNNSGNDISSIVAQIKNSLKEDVVLTEITKLNARLDELEEEEEEEEEEPSPQFNPDRIMLGIHGILDKIHKLRQPVEAKKTVISGPVDNSEPADKKTVPALSDEDLKILNEAINILRRNDENIAKHLMALAEISRDDKALYQLACNFINK